VSQKAKTLMDHLRGLEFSAFNSFHFVKFLLLPAAFDVGTSVSA